jgi:hypothetical protein
MPGQIQTGYLIPWTAILLDGPTVDKRVNNFTGFHGAQRFITYFRPPLVSVRSSTNPPHILTSNFFKATVAYLLKATTVEPDEHPLPANGFETTFISRQQILNKQEQMVAARERLGKHVPAAQDTRMNSVLCAGRAEES